MRDILSGGCGLGKVPERLPGSWQVAFALVEVERLGSGGVCFGDLAGRGEDVREFEQGVGVLAQQVGLRGKGCRRAREFLGFAITAPVGENPCDRPWLRAWGDRSSSAAASRLIAIRRWPRRTGSTLRRDGSGQFRRGGGQEAPLAHPVEGVVFEPKILLGGRRIAGEHRDEGRGLGSAAVIVGPRVSSRDFARSSVSCAAAKSSCIAYRPARFRRISAFPMGWFPISSRYPYIAVFLPGRVSGPRARPRRARRGYRRVACGRWPCARSRRRAAKHIRRRRIWRGSSAARPPAAGSGRFPDRPGCWNSRRNSGSARAISVAASSGFTLTQQERLNLRVGVLAVVAVGGGDALSVVEVALAFSNCPASMSAVPRLCIAGRGLGRRPGVVRPRGPAGSPPRRRRRGHARRTRPSRGARPPGATAHRTPVGRP